MSEKNEMTALNASVGADAEQSSQNPYGDIIPDYDEEFNTDFFDDDCYSDLRLIRMSDIKPQEIAWLWDPYIPQGKITIIQGDPGEGKTTLALALAASLSTGNSLHPLGRSLTFGLDGGFHITGESNMTAEELCNVADSGVALTKGDVAVEKLIELLSDGPMPSEDVFKYFDDMDIGRRTVNEAKKEAGVKSRRRDNIWYFEL